MVKKNLKKKILFFSTNMEIWEHTLPELLIAKYLKKNYEVNILTCGKNSNYCASIEMHNISARDSVAGKSARICNRCCQTAKISGDVLGIKLEYLKDYLTEIEKKKIYEKIDNTKSSDLLKLRFMGVEYGKNSIYEFILRYKKMSLILDKDKIDEYRVILKNSLCNLVAFSNYIKKTIPDFIFCYSPQYFSNINAMNYAVKKKIKVFFIEGGTNWGDRLGTMRVWDWEKYKMNNPATELWYKNNVIKKNLDIHKLDKIESHFTELFKGQMHTVYSGKIHSKKKLEKLKNNINFNKQKVILATMSSYDEAYAAYAIGGFSKKKVQSKVFKNQYIWIKNLLSWIKNKNNLFLIVRVHPRDFPNKREGQISEQAIHLKKKFQRLNHANSYINWPEDNISIYDLYGVADIVTTGWSITALEAMVLGLPIVTYDHNIHTYPKNIVVSGNSRNIYFKNLLKALKTGWSLNNSINACKWLGFNFVENNIVINSNIGKYEKSKNKIFKFIESIKRKTIFGRKHQLKKMNYNEKEMQYLNEMLKLNKSSIAEIKLKNKKISQRNLSSNLERDLVMKFLKSILIKKKN